MFDRSREARASRTPSGAEPGQSSARAVSSGLTASALGTGVNAGWTCTVSRSAPMLFTIAANGRERDLSLMRLSWGVFCDTHLEQSPECVTEDDDAGKTSYSIE